MSSQTNLLENYPSTKTGAALLLYRVKDYLGTDHNRNRDYNDQKSAQLCDALGDLLLAEVKVESWFEDLGTMGCSI